MTLIWAPLITLNCRSYSVKLNVPSGFSHMPHPHQARIHLTPHCASTCASRARWSAGSRSMCMFMPNIDVLALPTPCMFTTMA